MEHKTKSHDTISTIISKNLKELLDIYSMTIGDIVSKSSLPYSSIHSVLAGKTNPTIGTLSEIAKALNVEVSQLLGDIPFNTYNNTRYNRKVPVIKWSNVKNHIHNNQNIKIYHEIFVSSGHNMTEFCFAVHQDQTESAFFFPNSLLFFDKAMKVAKDYNEQYVLLDAPDSLPALRKIYLDGNNLFVQHPNEQIPMRTLNDSEQVIAWLFQVQTEFGGKL